MVRETYCFVPAPVPERPRMPFASDIVRLTRAERRVLGFVCAGYSNKEIAAILGKAEPTVKNQVASCLQKLGQSSRARLMAALR